MGRRVRRAAWSAIVAMMVVVPRAGLPATAPRVVVSVDNQARVTAEALEAAQDIATRIYEAAGIQLIWCGIGATSEPAAMHLSVLLSSRIGAERIVRGERVKSSVLGLSPRDSRRVYIFPDRIRRLAASEARRFETILGRTLAHEIGHQLLPEGHSASGIMRATLDYLSATAPAFSDEEGRFMRTLLAAERHHVDPRNVLSRLGNDVPPIGPE